MIQISARFPGRGPAGGEAVGQHTGEGDLWFSSRSRRRKN